MIMLSPDFEIKCHGYIHLVNEIENGSQYMNWMHDLYSHDQICSIWTTLFVLCHSHYTNTSKFKQSVVEMELILESPEPIPFLQHNKDCLQLETYKSFLNGGF